MPKPDHLSQKETDEIMRAFTIVRDHMRLTQWDLIIMGDPCEDDTIMAVTPCENHYTAQIQVCKDWSDVPDLSKIDTIVHELIHLMHRDLSDLIDDMTYGDSASSRDNTNNCQGSYRRIMERMVSHLTRLIADGLEMEWPPPSRTVVGKGIYTQGEHR